MCVNTDLSITISFLFSVAQHTLYIRASAAYSEESTQNTDRLSFSFSKLLLFIITAFTILAETIHQAFWDLQIFLLP